MQFDAGRYRFKIEDRTFSMADYSSFVHNIKDEIKVFKEKQALGVVSEDARYVQPAKCGRLKTHLDCYPAQRKDPVRGMGCTTPERARGPTITGRGSRTRGTW